MQSRTANRVALGDPVSTLFDLMTNDHTHEGGLFDDPLGEPELFGPALSPGLRLMPKDETLRGEVIVPSEMVIKLMPTRYLNQFSQQRKGPNTEQRALTESWRRQQIHPISAVMASQELALEYLEFTNRTWGSNKQPEELVVIPEGSEFAGQYAILVAGHSRVLGYQNLAVEAGHEPGDAAVDVRLFDVTDIRSILEIQLAENIHSAPAPVRTFRAIAEMYLFLQALQPAHRIPYKSFAEYYRFTEQQMSDALNFVRLPTQIIEMTDSGILHENIAIELARARGIIEFHYGQLTSKDSRFQTPSGADDTAVRQISDLQELEIQRQTAHEMFALLAHLDREGMIGRGRYSAGAKYIRWHARQLRALYRKATDDMNADSLFKYEETLPGRVERFQKLLTEDLLRYAGEDAIRGRLLARRLGQAAGVMVEIADPTQELVRGAEATIYDLRAARRKKKK